MVRPLPHDRPVGRGVAEEYKDKAGVFKMNVDENITFRSSTASAASRRSSFKGGQEQERIVGAVSREAIAKVSINTSKRFIY